MVEPRRKTRASANAADTYTSARWLSGTASVGDPQTDDARIQTQSTPSETGSTSVRTPRLVVVPVAKAAAEAASKTSVVGPHAVGK